MPKKLFLPVAVVACLLCGSMSATAQMISLWADTDMHACGVYPGMGGTFDMYIFVEPDQRGMFGVEFSIVNPSAAIFITPPGTPVWNPAANVTISVGDFFLDGISIGFGSCINTPTWIAKYNFTSYEMNPVCFEIDVATTGDPPVVQDHINAAICDEAHTKVEAFAFNCFGVNCDCFGNRPPMLSFVEATSPRTIYAEFNNGVHPWGYPPYNERFFIYDASNPEDTIRIFNACQEQEGGSFFILSLESSMVPGTDYILIANNICEMSHGCASSSMEFHYDGNFEDKPDLSVIKLGSDIDVPRSCKPFKTDFSIYNMGNLPSGPFKVQGVTLYFTSETRFEETAFMVEYDNLAAGDTLNDTIEVLINDNLWCGTYFYLRVDPFDELDEWTNCSNIKTIKYYNWNPVIFSVSDLPDDTGGWVTLNVSSSCFERYNKNIPARYDILRRIDATGDWELVEQIIGTNSETFMCNVPTVADSGDGGQQNWSVFRVEFIAPDGAPPEEVQVYTSCPDSGYSIDNSISTLLQAYTCQLTDNKVSISWRLSTDRFTRAFTIDRSADRAEFTRIETPRILVTTGEYSFIDDTVIPGREYSYRVGLTEDGLSRNLFETEIIQIPEATLTLYQNSPNPFNPSTTISWFLPGAMHVRLEIFDVSGRSIRLLGDEELEPGQHSIIWDGRGENGSAVSSGIYFLRLSAGKESITRKMVLLK